MKLSLQYRALAVLACLVLLLSSAAADPTPAAEDLVARMNESLKNSILNAERFSLEREERAVSKGDITVYDDQGNLEPGVKTLETSFSLQLGRDGARTAMMTEIGASTPLAFKERALIEDGRLIRASSHGQGSTQVNRSRSADAREALLKARPELGQFEGRFTDESLSLTEAFQAATSVTVQPDPEIVDGAETFVVEGVTPYGKFKSWLDPAGGCLPRRVEISKEGADLYQGRPLNSPMPPMPEGMKPGVPWESMKCLHILADSIGIQKIGDTFCLAGWSKYQSDCKYESGKTVSWVVEVVKNDLNLNPDPTVLANFFKLDIPDSAIVRDEDLPDANLRWVKGEIVPAGDHTLRDLIEEKEHSAPPGRPAAQAQPPAPQKAAAPPRRSLWFAAIPAICVGVATIGIYVRRKL